MGNGLHIYLSNLFPKRLTLLLIQPFPNTKTYTDGGVARQL